MLEHFGGQVNEARGSSPQPQQNRTKSNMTNSIAVCLYMQSRHDCLRVTLACLPAVGLVIPLPPLTLAQDALYYTFGAHSSNLFSLGSETDAVIELHRLIVRPSASHLLSPADSRITQILHLTRATHFIARLAIFRLLPFPFYFSAQTTL